MIKLVESLLSFVYEALTVYAASDQGKQHIVSILDAAEGAGIDVPFYEPSQPDAEGQQGSRGNVGSVGYNAEASDDYTAVPRQARIFPKGE